MRSADGRFQEPAQLRERGRAERRQVGADVGVLVEEISHEAASLPGGAARG